MTRTEDDLSHDGAFSDVSTISTSPVAQEDNGKYTPNKDQSLIKWAVLIDRFLYSTTVQNFTLILLISCYKTDYRGRPLARPKNRLLSIFFIKNYFIRKIVLCMGISIRNL